MRRGFAFFEILIIVSIVAILSLLLAPLLNSAAEPAQRDGRLVNIKAIALANIMYSENYDETYTIAHVWDVPSSNIVLSGVKYNTWVWNLYPYMISESVVADPFAPPIYRGGIYSDRDQATITPTFGYNHTHFSPTRPEVNQVRHFALQRVNIASPENTVMFTSRFEQATESALGYRNLLWYGNRTLTTYAVVDPPQCISPLVNQYCFGNWGNGTSWTQSTSIGLTNINSKFSGGTAFRYGGKAAVAMADGSCKFMTGPELAAGTNWRAGNTFSANTLVVNNRSRYLWDIQ